MEKKSRKMLVISLTLSDNSCFNLYIYFRHQTGTDAGDGIYKDIRCSKDHT